ncbi:S8 family serine peptidase, partial [Puniceibacterium confluentis]|uniref:S8 family serine peptidase n=1 Tax=Puniceibacterium confluentis TaxID=1958944 RepID=UPI0035696F11
MADPQTNAYSAYAQIAQKLGNDLALLALGLSEAPSRPSTGASTNGPEADFVATQVPSASNPFSSALAAPRVVDGMVAIDASSVDGDITGLLGELEALGLENGSTWGNTLSGLMPVDLLYKAAGVANLNQARGVMAQTNVGLVDSQADASMGTDVLRGLEGLDGTGVSIGVLSDSFDTNGTQQAVDIASGDLPSGGVAVLADLLGGSDEGRAMLQLIHDVAPGSDLLFRTAFLGQADFANGIQELFTAGSDIIVDDIFYFAEPFFMDGVIAQSADLAVQNGAMYFTSAGKSADNSYESAFNDSGFTLSYANNLAVPVVGKLHDFDPGAGVDFTQQVTIPGFSTFSLGLQWDDPFSSVNAASGGAVSDYDILVTDTLPSSVFVNVSSSVIGGDPFEVTSITNNGAAAAVANFVITHVSGPATNQLKYVMFRTGGTTIDEFRTDSSTVVGHSNANSAISTGAAYYAQTPNFGVTPPLLESFSSVGNTPIYFDDLGNRLASPEMRQGVDLVAPDGVDNTFFGSDSDGTGFPNFFGTSAAAPNAAAMAALLMQGSPSATPGDIFTAMRETAIDMGPAGLDSLSGAGLVDALAAFSALNSGIQLDGTPGPNRLIGTNLNDTLNGLGGNDILIGLGGADELNGGDDVDTADYSASPGGVTVLLDAGTGLGGDAEGDTLIGIERAIGSIHDDVLTGDSNANLLSGGGGDDIIDGNAGTDLLRGGPGSDTIRGGIGNDTLDGGADGDDLDGGPGMDELDYRGSPDPVQIDLGLGAASGGFAQNDTISGFEYILGSAFGDILNGDSGINRLVGLGGDDTMNGGPGDDLLRGGVGADDLDGGDGTADVVDYSDSNAGVSVDLGLNTASGAGSTADGDTIFGFERIYGSRHNDSLTGNDGDNILKGVTGDDTMNGGLGNDLLRGGRGIDNLFGGGDNDTLDGGRGGDLLDGGDGAGDVLDYRASAAAVTVNLALNTASGAGSDAAGDTISNFEAVFGSAFGDTLTGIDGGTTLLGFGGSDVLTGGNSSDLLRGHAGNDTMTGGLGNDTLDGMGGTDVAVIAGSVLDFSFVLGTLMTVTDTNPADGDQGTDQVDNVELLRFDDLDVTVLTNNAPLVLNQTTTRNEADGLMTIDLRTQVRDLDGDALSFSGITLGRDSALIPFGTPADGVISIDPATLGLNLGDDLTVNFQYQVTDDSGSLANNSAMGSFDLHIIGADDPLPDPPEANVAPVATPVTLSANEVDGDVSILLDTFVSDPNTGDVLTIT